MEGKALSIIKALADETRMRIVALLCRGPLSVNEVMEILGMGQSRISRHLRILTDAGLTDSERAGARVYYRMRGASSLAHDVVQVLGLFSPEAQNGRLPAQVRADMTLMQALLDKRRESNLSFFQQKGADQDRDQEGLIDFVFYRKKLASLVQGDAEVLVDLGCGAGRLFEWILPSPGKHWIGVDQSPNMLELARSRFPSIDFRLGSLEHLPLRDSEVTVAVASMVLHHIADPLSVLTEISRVMRPGGELIIAELSVHSEEIMREKFQDFWLGFDARKLSKMLDLSGFQVRDQSSGKGSGRLPCLFLRALKK